MVIVGGLEVLAAGYLYHKHEQNKKERQRLAEEDAAIEEAIRKLENQRRRPKSASANRPACSPRTERTSAGSGQAILGAPGGNGGGRGSNPGRKPRRDHSAPPAQPPRPLGSPSLSASGSPNAHPSPSPGYLPAPAPGYMPPQHPGYGAAPPILAAAAMPSSPPPAYPGHAVVTGWPSHWGPMAQSAPSQGQVVIATPHGPSSVAGMPQLGMGYPQVLGGMPPTPPIEYGWKPGVSHADATETAEEREARRARRMARRLERSKSEGAVSSGSGSGSASTSVGGNGGNYNGVGNGTARGFTGLLAGIGRAIEKASSSSGAGGGGSRPPQKQPGPSQPRPYQRVRFTGLAEGMEVNTGSRYETMHPGARAHRREAGGGVMDCGGGGGGGC